MRLVDSGGRHGSWVALSHCWGTPEKRPLVTTRANIQKHMEGLEMDSLPKTFRDAILLTRSLGIRYVWIDCLCIVQDDPADWKRESNNMGKVYQYSTVTIAAANAKDSSEGCFFDDACSSYRPTENLRKKQGDVIPGGGQGVESLVCEALPQVRIAVTLPVFEEDKITGSFSVAPWLAERSYSTTVLDTTPLFRRGWALQEWALSRRTFIFLKDSILWSCRELCVDDTGTMLKRYVQRPSLFDWASLIQEYTKRNLTYESDGMIAIQGLANMVQSQRDDTYFAGMWPADLPQSLLWKIRNDSVGRHALRRSHLPSWTWARLEGHVGFQMLGDPFKPRGTRLDSRHLKKALQEFSIQPSWTLQVIGPTTHLGPGVFEFVARSERTRRMYKSIFKRSFDGYSNCRQAGGSISGKQIVVIPSDDSSSVKYKYENHELAGWATLDLDAIPESGSVYCIAVMKEIGAVTRQGLVNGDPRFIQDNACHVLVLQEVPSYGTRPRFTRIGIGVVQESRRQWYLGHAEIV